MTPTYVTIAAGVPKIVELNNNTTAGFELSIRVNGTATIEFALEDALDATEQPPSGTPGPTWVAAPNAVNANGVLHLTGTPYRLVRFTSAGGATATILQQGVM